ncbi:hypothetical protein SVAN01_06595 [Stagonosporopsis vannaccii]|nr:hypothetical protein SVAN01_06595 [Stagonosporopsis vannaccii]
MSAPMIPRKEITRKELPKTQANEPAAAQLKEFGARDTSTWEVPEEEQRKKRHLHLSAGAGWTLSDRFDRALPPHKRYLGCSRRTFLIVLLIALVCLLALIIGLAVGLSKKSETRFLPLPTNTDHFTGDLTYYAPGLGACGVESTESDAIVSVSHYLYDAVQIGTDPNQNPLCGKKIRATRADERTGKQVSIDLKVVDRCTGCEPTDLDVSPAMFDKMADHDLATGLPHLGELWTTGSDDKLPCTVCAELIDEDALIRTFCPTRLLTAAIPTDCTRTITALTWHLSFYDRHQRCLPADTNIIAISHVWNPDVSKAHHQGTLTPIKEQSSVVEYIFESLQRISEGLAKNIDEKTEIWYDYVCVPQWNNKRKEKIMRVIPDIFQNASFVLVHFDDVSVEAVRLLREGRTTKERVSGITQICNARWFSRVWTAMEFIRSRTVKVLLKEGHMEENANDMFIPHLMHAWNEERKRFAKVQDLERLADIGKNIVPWNLGHLMGARQRGKIDFAVAFAILARRRCYSDRDFLHALLGIVKADLRGEEIKADLTEALAQIAIRCMQAGDYSPLLLNPEPVSEIGKRNRAAMLRICGYDDIYVFGIGKSIPTQPPTYFSESKFALNGCNLKLESIGKVTFVSKMTHLHHDPILRFLQIAMFVLDNTGPDPIPFINTLVARIYNFSEPDRATLLADWVTCGKIARILQEWYDNTTRFAMIHRDKAEKLADLLGLRRILPQTHRIETPMGYMDEHGGGIHSFSPGSLIVARCPGCHEGFVYQAGLHVLPSQVRGALAYRIAGVHYMMARPDGAGILVKEGVIVGRLLWATRACECKVAEMVHVKLGDMPKRVPK